ncbi:hypothetical protein [Bradyrhizobium sp. LA6.10]
MVLEFPTYSAALECNRSPECVAAMRNAKAVRL